MPNLQRIYSINADVIEIHLTADSKSIYMISFVSREGEVLQVLFEKVGDLKAQYPIMLKPSCGFWLRGNIQQVFNLYKPSKYTVILHGDEIDSLSTVDSLVFSYAEEEITSIGIGASEVAIEWGWQEQGKQGTEMFLIPVIDKKGCEFYDSEMDVTTPVYQWQLSHPIGLLLQIWG